MKNNEEQQINFDTYKTELKKLISPEAWLWAMECADEWDFCKRNGFDVKRIAEDVERSYALDTYANSIDLDNNANLYRQRS